VRTAGADLQDRSAEPTIRVSSYGVPNGTDGRVIYFNKKLFARLACRDDWNPKSGTTSAAGQKLKTASGVDTFQINAARRWEEATHPPPPPPPPPPRPPPPPPPAKGFLPLIAGTASRCRPTRRSGRAPAASNAVRLLPANLPGGPQATEAAAEDSRTGFPSFAGSPGTDRHARRGRLLFFWRSIIAPTRQTTACQRRRCPTATRPSVTRSSRPRSRARATSTGRTS